ncbi:hypothetical protein [Photobacterium damselae]|uniref:hypothetical protein n=1 Tax=Photobacterium damselae TaxID=38293 RepID=UPI0040698E11
MPFAPPTFGYEEDHISQTIIDHLQPNNSCYAIRSTSSIQAAGIATNDVIVIDRSLSIRHNGFALIRLDDEIHLIKTVLQKGSWFAVNDERRGKLSGDIEVIGIVTNVIKDQLND